jgi:glycosyltransferase involved in cell wall biosynthesis
MVLEVHDFYESAFGWVNRGVFRRISGLVVTNRIKMKHLAKAYGIPESRMIHLPNAVDVERFNRRETKEEARTKLGLAKDRKLAVYTGSLFTWKGIHTLARAAKFLPGDWEVIFAGGNNHERAEFRAFLDRERLTNVTLLPLPYEDRERAPLFMRAADVVVLPNTAHNLASKYETSPVKLFEYMASGTPIIASDLPSIRNIADEGMVWFFKADNPQSLAEAVMRISYDPAAAEKKAEVAEQAVQAYAWERRIPTVISFIRGIS